MTCVKAFEDLGFERRSTAVRHRMEGSGFDLLVHFQSGMWLDDFGAAISESFVVTEGGGERPCAVERDLFGVA